MALTIILGIPIAIVILYLTFRIASTAIITTWWEFKLKYTRKILEILKENPKKKGE